MQLKVSKDGLVRATDTAGAIGGSGIFLLYFLSILYIGVYISEYNVYWYLLTVPSLLFCAWLCVRSVERFRREQSAWRLAFSNDWIWPLIAFALLSPLSAMVSGSVLNAAAISILSLVIFGFIISGGASFRFVQFLFFLSCFGAVLSYYIGINPFGYLPNQEIGGTFECISRVSLFPNLPDSAMFAVVMAVATVSFRTRAAFIVLPLTAYIIFFSYSRTAYMAIGLVFLAEMLRFVKIGPSVRFLAVLLALVSFVFFAGPVVGFISSLEGKLTSVFEMEPKKVLDGGPDIILQNESFPEDEREPVILESNVSQNNCADRGQVTTRLTRTNEATLERDGAPYAGLHVLGRAELWRDHIAAFAASPVTGSGREGTLEFLRKGLPDSSVTGTESFFTRILAEFGVSALLFWAAIWRLYVFADRVKNRAASNLVICLLVFLALYGSSATPYSFVFLTHVGLIGFALSHQHSPKTPRDSVGHSAAQAQTPKWP